MPRRRKWSIARQIALLILTALLLLTCANIVVTFVGPPPRPIPFRLTDLVMALRDGTIPGPPGTRLHVETGAPDFVPRRGEVRHPDTEAVIAASLALPTGSVRLATAEEPRQPPGGGVAQSMLFGDFSIGMQDASGHWRILRDSPQPLFTAWHRTTLAITLGLALILALIAARITTGIVSPIQRLSREADQAYVDGRRGTITIDGPPEVAHLATTIAAMRDRFAALVENRTMMLAAIAHDMATPLSRLEFRIAKLPPDARDQAEADLAELSEMIASILDFAKGRQGLDQAPLSLVDLVRDLVARRDRPDAPLTLGPMPATAEVMGDRVALRRLVENLISNAQRYAGGGTLSIEAEPQSYRLTVADTGPGFDPELAERLFDPFFRVESSRNRETAGTGLGLATAKAIAEAHGGTLIAVNREGGGAAFVLTLPALGPDAPAD